MKLFKILPLVALVAFCFACQSPEKKDEFLVNKEAETQKLNSWFDKVWDEQVSRSPEWQGYLAIEKDKDRWDDYSEENRSKELEFTKGYLKILQDSFLLENLTKQGQVSYMLFKQNCEEDIEAYQFRHYGYPVNQMFGMQSHIPSFLINFHKVLNEKDAEDYISRLNGVKKVFDQVVMNLKENEKNGAVAPTFIFDMVIDDSKNTIQGFPFSESLDTSVLYKDFHEKVANLDLPEEKKGELLGEAKESLLNSVKPGYSNLIAFLEDQKSRSSNKAGVWKFEEGEAYYKYRLKKITTTDLTADSIYDLGMSEISRIHGEMHEIMEKTNFESDSLQAFFDFIRDGEQFYYSNDEAGKAAFLDTTEVMIANMKKALPKLFKTLPKAGLTVKPVEAFREKSAGIAFYYEPAPDGSRPGIYYVNMYNMKHQPKTRMEALAYHEAIPGHHMQLSIAQELEGLPKFRKNESGYTAYVEGWGLYAEYIPKELGFYADPYSDFGRLSMELWRACRLVVDVGIHAKKWTREESIDFYASNTPNAYGDCVKMVERHIVMPGQATAYKIGQLEILNLRNKAKETLGYKFDIREFHNVVLTNGALPLDVLKQLVDEYVEKNM